jgi:hypothetical protein
VVDKAPSRVIVTAPPARRPSGAPGDSDLDEAGDAQRTGAPIV